jgi:hypothetical protein
LALSLAGIGVHAIVSFLSGDQRWPFTHSAADRLNLIGIVTPVERPRDAAGNRIVQRNGIPLAAMEGDMLRVLDETDPETAARAAAAAGCRVPAISGDVGRASQVRWGSLT